MNIEQVGIFVRAVRSNLRSLPWQVLQNQRNSKHWLSRCYDYPTAVSKYTCTSTNSCEKCTNTQKLQNPCVLPPIF